MKDHLAVSAAALHHLFSPERVLEGCARILKRGGYTILFEPFENGNAILRIIYSAILRDSRQKTLPPDTRDLLQAMIQDFDTRKGRDKSPSVFRHLDDKWLFTRPYFEELAEKYRFSDCIIYPLHPTECPFECQTETNLRLGIGKGRDALPDWAWETLRQYDQFFSADMKKELLIEGCVILKK